MNETIKIRPVDIVVYHAQDIRRNETKTIVKQPYITFHSTEGKIQILEKSVLFDFLNYIYVNTNQPEFAKDEFNFMYETFDLTEVLNAARKDVEKQNFNLDMFFELSPSQYDDRMKEDVRIIKSVLHEGLQIDSTFASSCSGLWNVFFPFHIPSQGITKVKVNHLGKEYLCDRYTFSTPTKINHRDESHLIFDITQIPVEYYDVPKATPQYVLRARIKCGGGYVQVIPARAFDGYLGLEEMDVLSERVNSFVKDARTQDVSCVNNRVAWNRGHKLRWFSDKNRLEHENFLFFL
tara:strand:+ start:924 stop:1802 length:879 start_codon:yes stop_codon:yes gene_type:complete